MISVLPRITAKPRLRKPLGVYNMECERIHSPKPGITLSAISIMASGVTSRWNIPVPPDALDLLAHLNRTIKVSKDRVIRGETISQEKLDEIIRKVKLALGD